MGQLNARPGRAKLQRHYRNHDLPIQVRCPRALSHQSEDNLDIVMRICPAQAPPYLD